MLTKTLPPPRNQKAKLLKDLIEGLFISEQDYKINGFRSRLHELRVDYEFGNAGKYKVHFLLEVDREKAEAIYTQINKR